MATITWKIDWLECKPTQGNLSNVVIVAGWRCSGVDGEHSSSIYNTIALGPPGPDFTSFNDLTEQQVLGWCWDRGVNKGATEAAIEKLIAQQINPPTTKPALPWV